MYIGQQGNVFSCESIQKAIESGLELEKVRDGAIFLELEKSMGIDAGFGSSKFGIVITQLTYGQAEVVFADEYERPDFGDMIQRVITIRQNYGGINYLLMQLILRLSDHSSMHLMNL